MRAARPARRAAARVAARAPAQRRRALQVPAGQRHPVPDRVRRAGRGRACCGPGHATPFVMFVRPRNPAEETWTGRRAGVEGAVRDFGADAAFSAASSTTSWPRSSWAREEIHFPFGREPELDAAVARLLGRLRVGRAARAPRAGAARATRALTLHEMRLIKSPDEVAMLRRAAEITAEAHIGRHARRAARGASEHEIEALIDYTFRRRGGTGPGLSDDRRRRRERHHPPLRREPRRRWCAGSCCSIDAGCEVDGYTADVTRTFADRRARSRRRSGASTRRCWRRSIAAIEAVKPGATLDAIHEQVVEQLTAPHGGAGAARPGDVPALVESGAYQAVLHAPHQPLAGHGRSRRRLLLRGRRGAPARARHGADHRARPLRRAPTRRRRPSTGAWACASRTTSWSPPTATRTSPSRRRSRSPRSKR